MIDAPFVQKSRTLPRLFAFAFRIAELLALLFLLIAAAKARSGFPCIPFADSDTWGYLKPAAAWLGGAGFRQCDGRDWLYPALLALFLKSAASFSGIFIWQKALGFASAILMAVAWRCWVSTLPFRRWTLCGISLLGALPIYVQLVNQQSIFYEMAIRPEAVLPCFVYAQLACLMGYFKFRWQTSRRVPSVILGAGSIFFAYGCFLLKPSWGGSFILTSLPAFIGLFQGAVSSPARSDIDATGEAVRREVRSPGVSVGARFLTVGLGVAASILILWLPGKILVIPDSDSRTLLPDALFCVHAKLIDSYLRAKSAALPDSDQDKAKLQSFLSVLEAEIRAAEASPHAYEKLHLDADYLMHSAALTNAINAYAGDDVEKFRSFCISCYIGAAIHDPARFAGKVGVQFTHFLFLNPKTFFVDRFDFAKEYKESADDVSPQRVAAFGPALHEMFLRYRADVIVQADQACALEKKPRLRALRRAFARLALPIEILFLLALAAAFVSPVLRNLRLSGSAALFLFLAPLGNAVTVCIVHALDITRYNFTYGGYLLFALTAMGVFVVVISLKFRYPVPRAVWGAGNR